MKYGSPESPSSHPRDTVFGSVTTMMVNPTGHDLMPQATDRLPPAPTTSLTPHGPPCSQHRRTFHNLNIQHRVQNIGLKLTVSDLEAAPLQTRRQCDRPFSRQCSSVTLSLCQSLPVSHSYLGNRVSVSRRHERAPGFNLRCQHASILQLLYLVEWQNVEDRGNGFPCCVYTMPSRNDTGD